ncbi:MAG: N-methyl-L-tryptophan oxidase [Cyclobacteriaceae bacterium]
MKRRKFITAAATAALGIPALVKAKTADRLEEAKPNPMQRPAMHYDAIVIGVGTMGSAACYYLSQRGHKVLGLEQFDISHDQGSHAGQSRIIRMAYGEDSDYVPLLQRAYSNWKSLEEQTKSKVFEKTGLAYFGKPDNEFMMTVKKSASQYDIPIAKSGPDKAKDLFPAFKVPNDFEIIFEPNAGFLTPERAILLYSQQAIAKGAHIRTREKVKGWKQLGGKIQVDSSSGTFTCDKLIITAGGWASKVLPNLKVDLKVTKQMLAWISPKNWDLFSLGKFPCWILEDPERGSYYGFPILPANQFGGPIGLKLAHHFPGELSDPDKVNRNVTAGTEEDIRYALKKYLPLANHDILSLKSCLYTSSKDENFIIDHLPGYEKQVTIACGFSGHGFKFASAIGEVLADMAMNGKTELPIGFLGLQRFS